ncbi:YopX family protein [Latilactobacillus sakei subsp. sakei]|uniref:YopX family protein n=1 Tax=Latilactobacillus sakei TaxID=1599 RepID=UPI00285E2060|nr:YopX family protein [Latilactobacillus sakei]MDR7924930.1 YopX family protein [Latilactobacillus sakei subsp. sakei]
MREIKFRAWHKTYDLLCDVVEIVFGDDDNYVAVENGEYIERWRFDDIELMQYTGLKDVHGVKIYEGDVVRFDTNVQILESEVTYYHGMFTIKKYGEKIPLFTGLKVIGNKFENPKLLEAD